LSTRSSSRPRWLQQMLAADILHQVDKLAT
jgi:hypothetical protein